MLKLRLSRVGSKKRPVYHLIAADSRARRDGRHVELLGYYIPEKNVLVFKQDRIKHWLSVGAQVSGLAERLIKASKTAPAPAAPKRSRSIAGAQSKTTTAAA